MRSTRLPAVTAAAALGSRGKGVRRARLAGLGAIVAVGGLVLTGASPASASPMTQTPDPALVGTWANMDPAAADISDIVITENAGVLKVDAFYNCSPGCEEGNVPATVYGANVKATTADTFQANFSPVSDANDLEVLLGTLTTIDSQPTLTVEEFITLLGSDTSGSNWVANESFGKVTTPITPGIGGKPSAVYLRGIAAQPVKSLIGVWKPAKFDPGLEEIDIEPSASIAGSPLSIHVLGQCSSSSGPAPCDWGTSTTGSTYGATINSMSGATAFLVFYKFPQSTRLLSGTINPDGTLAVSIYSEFSSGTGMSNYLYTETLTLQ